MSDNVIDTLSLEIESNSHDSEEAIERLVKTLTKLKTSVSSLSNLDLTKFSQSMKTLIDSTKGFDGESIQNQVSALRQLAAIKAENMTSVSSGIKSMAEALKSMSGITIPNLEGASNLVAAMKEISQIGKIDIKSDVITATAMGISDMANALRLLNGIEIPNLFGIDSLVENLRKLGGVNSTQATENLPQLAQDLVSFISNLNSVGGLTFDFTGVSNLIQNISRLGGKNATAAVANLKPIKDQLLAFISGLNGLESVTFDVEGLSNLVVAITKLGGSAASKAVPNIQDLANALKKMMETLSSAPKVSENLIQMTQAMAQLASSGGKVSLMSSQVASGFMRISPPAFTAKKNTLNLASAFGKLYATFWAITRAFSMFKKAIDISSDLTEVQNVVDVTFGDMKQKVEDLASTSIQDFGMSELTAKQISSRFQAMGMSMGFAQEEMADMSIELTKLAGDMASFYNLEQADVARKLQSIFTGESQPLRSLGLDLTNASLQAWALSQGIDANIDKMSQAEKAMLRYRYVLANTAAAQGDYARTADTWHNSIVRLGQTFEQIGSIVGGVLINTFKPFVAALNSVMQSVLTFAKTVANALGAIFGWTIEIDSGGIASDFETAGAAAEEIEDGTGGAAKNLKDMNKYVANWNEVNNMTSNKQNGGGGGGAGGGADLSEIGDAAEVELKKTESILDKFTSDIDSLYALGNYIGTQLSEALGSIDWGSVYESAWNFGTGLAQFLNGLITPGLFAMLGNTISGAINTAIYAALSFGQEFDFENLGTSVAFGVNFALAGIDWNSALTAAKTWGEGIANAINSFLHFTDFESVGSTIANALNTVVQFALSKNMTLEWTALGDSIAQTINGFFSTFNFSDLAQSINLWAKGILDTIITALDKTDWEAIGASIGTFLADLDFLEIGGKVIEALWKAISAAFETWTAAFDAAPIETTILTAVALLQFTGIGNLIVSNLFSKILTSLTTSAAGFATQIGTSIATWFAGTTLATSISATMAETGASLPAVLFSAIWTPIQTFFTVTLPGLLASACASLGAVFGLEGVAAIVAGGSLIALAAAAVVTAIVAAVTHWDEIKTFFSETLPAWWQGTAIPFFQSIPKSLTNIWEQVKSGASKKWNQFLTFMSGVPKSVEKIISEISDWFNRLPENIGIALIGALVKVSNWGAEVYSYFSQKIPEIVNSVATWFSQMPGKIYDSIKTFLTNINTWGTEVFNNFNIQVSNIINNVVTWFSEMPGKIYDTIIKVKEKISEWSSKAISFFEIEVPKIVDKVIEFFGKLPEKIIDVGENLIKGLWNGIENMTNWLGTKVSNFVTGVIDAFKEGFDEHSPSKVAYQIGDYFTIGLGNGITNRFDETYKDIKNFTDDIASMKISVPEIDLSIPTPDFTPSAYNLGSFQSTMQMEMDSKMAELEFENRQLRETMEENNRILEKILAQGIVLNDIEFTKRYKSSAMSFYRRTGTQLGTSY